MKNVEAMEESMGIKPNANAKLSKPEVCYEIEKYKLSESASRTMCEMLGVTKSGGLAGVRVKLALEIVKKHVGSTSGLVATNQECKDAARILGVPLALADQAFLGRPLRQMVEISRWLLSKRHEEDFDVKDRLGDWALAQEDRELAKNIEARAMTVYDGLREME